MFDSLGAGGTFNFFPPALSAQVISPVNQQTCVFVFMDIWSLGSKRSVKFHAGVRDTAGKKQFSIIALTQ